jgi:DNA-directed RNA polymerase beta subunit
VNLFEVLEGDDALLIVFLWHKCRERHATYRGKLRVRVGYKINNGSWRFIDRECGNIPIMLGVSLPSSNCG